MSSSDDIIFTDYKVKPSQDPEIGTDVGSTNVNAGGSQQIPQCHLQLTIETRNPTHNQTIPVIVDFGTKAVYKHDFGPNQNQLNNPQAKQKKRKYNYDTPLPDEDEEKKRQKAINASVWRNVNNIAKDNTIVSISILPSLCISPSAQEGIDESQMLESVAAEKKSLEIVNQQLKDRVAQVYRDFQNQYPDKKETELKNMINEMLYGTEIC